MAFGIRADGSSSNAPFLEVEEFDCARQMVHVSVQAERDAAVEQARELQIYMLWSYLQPIKSCKASWRC